MDSSTALPVPIQPDDNRSQHGPTLVFRIGPVQLGLEAKQVREVVRSIPVTIPSSDDTRFAGWTTIRGETVAVIDGHALIGRRPVDESDGCRLIVLKCPAVCLRVDAVLGLHTLCEVPNAGELDESGIRDTSWLDSTAVTQDEAHIGMLSIENLLAIAGISATICEDDNE